MFFGNMGELLVLAEECVGVVDLFLILLSVGLGFVVDENGYCDGMFVVFDGCVCYNLCFEYGGEDNVCICVWCGDV